MTNDPNGSLIPKMHRRFTVLIIAVVLCLLVLVSLVAFRVWFSEPKTTVRVGIVDSGVTEDLFSSSTIGETKSFVRAEYGYPVEEHADDVHNSHANLVLRIMLDNYENVEVFSAKIEDKDGRITEHAVAAAVNWLIEKKVVVINLSLGGLYNGSIVDQSLEAAWNNGILVVAAAGNEGVSAWDNFGCLLYPGSSQYTLSVGATLVSSLCPYSSLGPTPQGYWGPDVVTEDTVETGDRGTSFAAPRATALAAELAKKMVDAGFKSDPAILWAAIWESSHVPSDQTGAENALNKYGAGVLDYEASIQWLESALDKESSLISQGDDSNTTSPVGLLPRRLTVSARAGTRCFPRSLRDPEPSARIMSSQYLRPLIIPDQAADLTPTDLHQAFGGTIYKLKMRLLALKTTTVTVSGAFAGAWLVDPSEHIDIRKGINAFEIPLMIPETSTDFQGTIRIDCEGDLYSVNVQGDVKAKQHSLLLLSSLSSWSSDSPNSDYYQLVNCAETRGVAVGADRWSTTQLIEPYNDPSQFDLWIVTSPFTFRNPFELDTWSTEAVNATKYGEDIVDFIDSGGNVIIALAGSEFASMEKNNQMLATMGVQLEDDWIYNKENGQDRDFPTFSLCSVIANAEFAIGDLNQGLSLPYLGSSFASWNSSFQVYLQVSARNSPTGEIMTVGLYREYASGGKLLIMGSAFPLYNFALDLVSTTFFNGLIDWFVL